MPDFSVYGPVAGTVIVVFMFLRRQKETDALDIKKVEVLEKMNDKLDKLGTHVKNSDEYLRQRNGRDNEMHKERMEADARNVELQKKFFTQIIKDMKDLKQSDIALVEAVKSVRGKSD